MGVHFKPTARFHSWAFPAAELGRTRTSILRRSGKVRAGDLASAGRRNVGPGTTSFAGTQVSFSVPAATGSNIMPPWQRALSGHIAGRVLP